MSLFLIFPKSRILVLDIKEVLDMFTHHVCVKFRISDTLSQSIKLYAFFSPLSNTSHFSSHPSPLPNYNEVLDIKILDDNARV